MPPVLLRNGIAAEETAKNIEISFARIVERHVLLQPAAVWCNNKRRQQSLMPARVATGAPADRERPGPRRAVPAAAVRQQEAAVVGRNEYADPCAIEVSRDWGEHMTCRRGAVVVFCRRELSNRRNTNRPGYLIAGPQQPPLVESWRYALPGASRIDRASPNYWKKT